MPQKIYNRLSLQASKETVMTRANGKLKLFLTILTITLLSVATYMVILPEYIAEQYINRVHQAANSLQTGYIQLEKSTERAFINDPTLDTTDLTREVESLRNLVRENRINLTRFISTADNYEPLPFTGFTSQAKAADILQDKAVVFAEQSDEAFTHYNDLVDFIKRYDTTAKLIQEYTDEFNSTADLNLYAGQYDRMRFIAEQIRSDAKALETAPTPHEAAAFKTASVQSFQEIANGFDTVALGLQIPADAVIYNGANRIEAVDQMINEPNQVIYSRDVLSSRTIKSIQELREKLEIVLS
jgi:hypothetical protein